MAKKPPPGPDVETTPQDFPQTTPRDLHPTTDIRFVIWELSGISKNVERLIADVKTHGEKIDGLRHQATWVKGVIAASTVFITIIVAISGFVLNAKWDAAIAALKAMKQ